MALDTKSVLDKAFIVRQAGLVYGTEGFGVITGHDTKENADVDVADRNSRAKEMGLKATYEAVAMKNRKPV